MRGMKGKKESLPVKLERVALDLLDTGAGAPFRFRHRLPGEDRCSTADEALSRSIGELGLIAPPLLAGPSYGSAEDLTVILGHRRIAAASLCGLESIDALILAPQTDDRDLSGLQDLVTLVWLEDSIAAERPSELEKIVILGKLASFAGSRLREFLPAISKIFGKEISSDFAKRLTGILDLDGEILDHLHYGTISTGDLLLLSAHPSIDELEAVRLLSCRHLNRSRQREAVKLIIRLADQGDGRWADFAARSGGDKILTDALAEAVYPRMSSDLDLISKSIASIHLPPGAAIRPPENLEGSGYFLTYRIQDKENLKILIKRLQSAVDDGTISVLLDKLRGKRLGSGKEAD